MPDLRYVTLESRGVLRLAGEDARSFLQGLVSNDVALLGPQRAIHAALLTPQGKYLFDFLLFEQDGELLLDAERERLPALQQRLALYRLRAKVTITEASRETAALAILGERAAAALGLPPEPGAAVAVGGGVAAVDPRHVGLGVRALLPRGEVEDFLKSLGTVPAPFAAWDRLRLELGVPDGSRDLIVDRSILLEAGFDELNGVSFTKGCFVGQELTARTKHRALIKKRLIPVRVEGPLPDPGTPVTRGAKEAGEMRSGCDGLGLALLRLEQLAGTGAEPLRAGGATLVPLPPSWLRLPPR
jgi:folate-binding protein YgfZ